MWPQKNGEYKMGTERRRIEEKRQENRLPAMNAMLTNLLCDEINEKLQNIFVCVFDAIFMRAHTHTHTLS